MFSVALGRGMIMAMTLVAQQVSQDLDGVVQDLEVLGFPVVACQFLWLVARGRNGHLGGCGGGIKRHF